MWLLEVWGVGGLGVRVVGGLGWGCSEGGGGWDVREVWCLEVLVVGGLDFEGLGLFWGMGCLGSWEIGGGCLGRVRDEHLSTISFY